MRPTVKAMHSPHDALSYNLLWVWWLMTLAGNLIVKVDALRPWKVRRLAFEDFIANALE